MKYQSTTSEDILSIKLEGEFTFTDNEQFQQMVKDIQGSRMKQVSLDFAGLDFIDSAALSMLLVLRETCNKMKIGLSICNGSGRVKEVMEEMKFSKFIKTTP